MKAYKGFNKDMTCRGFQFKEGEVYEHDGDVKVCESGFHACERPSDCFDYYAPASSVYHEVEMTGDISKADDDTKIAAKTISSVKSIIKTAQISKDEFLFVEDYEWLWNKLTILAAEMRQEVEK